MTPPRVATPPGVVAPGARTSPSDSERSLLERSSDGVVVFESGTVVFANPAFAAMVGASTAADTIGRPIGAFLDPPYLKAVRSRILATDPFAATDPVVEHRLRRFDGHQISVEIAAVLFLQDGSPAVQMFVRDITARRREEAAAAEARRMESLGTVVAGVAQGMNEVLTAIMGIASETRHEAGPRSDLAALLDAAERARTLVANLLGSAGSGPARLVRLDANMLVEAAAGWTRGEIADRDDVHVEVEAGPSLEVEVDPVQMCSALLLLCRNALEAMPDGGRLSISARLERPAARPTGLPPGTYVRIDLSDTGIGMTAAVLARAVEPFFTTKRRGAGTGLGLSMAYGAALNHGGRLVIDSAPGSGTRVSLYLPACGS